MMKNIFFILAIFLSLFSGTDKMYVSSGWNLKGVSVDINNVNDFLNTNIVKNIYIYRSGSFVKKDTIKEIKSGEGFWIYAKKSGWLDVNTNLNNSDDLAIPTPRSYYSSNWWDWGDWANWGYDWYCENYNHSNCYNDSNTNTKDISLSLVKGWNLKGSSSRFKIKDVFDSSCVDSVRSVIVYKPYNDNLYKYDKDSNYYIMKYNGFWVKAKESCVLKHKDNNSGGNDDANPPSI